MIDIMTHKIIDMIESRDLNDVVVWLSSFPNLQIFSRDGSPTYRNAITSAHPINLQVSDRFHIFKNLTDYAQETLKKELKKAIPLKINETEDKQIEKDIPKTMTFEEKGKRALELLAQGMNKTGVAKQLQMDIRTVNKLSHMTESEFQQFFNTKNETKRKQKIELKRQRIQEVQELIKNGLTYTEVARELGLCRQTVKKYASNQVQVEHASLGVERPSKLSPYHDEIHQQFKQGWTATQIAKHIQSMGCTATISTIAHYVSKIKKENSQHGESLTPSKKYVSRGAVLSLMFHPLTMNSRITEDQFEQLCQQYPIFKTIYETVWVFKDIFKTKDTSLLLKWVNKTKQLHIPEMDSFIIGLERDFEAVKNAVIYDYNNGLAEGSVNKVKVIKRIMYGRCHFSTLRNKVLSLENLAHFN